MKTSSSLYFYAERDGACLLVKTVNGKRTSKQKTFPTPRLALAWSQTHGTNFYYVPVFTLKVLFMPSPGKLGVLVITDMKERTRQRVMTFTDAFAALDWALRNRAALVYYQGVNPPSN